MAMPNHLPVVRMMPCRPETDSADYEAQKKVVEQEPVTITQADLEAMKPRTVRPRRVHPLMPLGRATGSWLSRPRLLWAALRTP